MKCAMRVHLNRKSWEKVVFCFLTKFTHRQEVPKGEFHGDSCDSGQGRLEGSRASKRHCLPHTAEGHLDSLGQASSCNHSTNIFQIFNAYRSATAAVFNCIQLHILNSQWYRHVFQIESPNSVRYCTQRGHVMKVASRSVEWNGGNCWPAAQHLSWLKVGLKYDRIRNFPASWR